MSSKKSEGQETPTIDITTTASLGFIKEEKPTEEETEKEVAEQSIELTEADEWKKEVEIRPKASGRIYLGNKWYELTGGEISKVPKHVKDVLYEQNALDPV